MPSWQVKLVPALSVLGLGAVLLVGCSGDSGSSDNKGGGPLPNQRAGETYPGARAEVAGQVLLTGNGCLYVVVDGVRRFAVWPAGAVQDKDDATAVRLVDGPQIRPGDSVNGSAALMPAGDLAGMPDGYWGQQVTFCAPEDAEVLVLDTVTLTP